MICTIFDNAMDSKTIRSSKILVAINKGKDVILKDKIIEGDLIVEVPKCIHSKLIINSCIFTGRVSFHHIIFEEDIDFKGTIFQCEVSFDASHFMKNAFFCSSSGEDYPFKYAQFHKYAEFGCTHFYQDAHFQKVSFREGATFKSATFHENARPDFSLADFGDDTEFVDVTFENNIDFHNARFRGQVSFSSGTRFEKSADFGEAFFYERAYFLSCLFKGDAKFGSATFSKGLSLDSSHFFKKLTLDHIEARNIRLLGATFGNESTLSLKGSYFDRLVVRWATIEGHLDLKVNGTFTLEDIDAIFLFLVKSFKDLGFFDDADKCYLQYRHRISERLKTEKYINRIPDGISYWFYGHGVDYWPPLKLVGIFIISTLITFVIFDYIYSFDKAFPIIYANQHNFVAIFSNPTSNERYLTWPSILGIFGRTIGTILLSAFLVTIARKTLR